MGGCSKSGADHNVGEQASEEEWLMSALNCAASTSKRGLFLEEDSEGSDKICDTGLELNEAATVAAGKMTGGNMGTQGPKASTFLKLSILACTLLWVHLSA